MFRVDTYLWKVVYITKVIVQITNMQFNYLMIIFSEVGFWPVVTVSQSFTPPQGNNLTFPLIVIKQMYTHKLPISYDNLSK